MISFPFDSQVTGTDEAGLPIYDRASNSEDLARWFSAFFTNGIFASSGFAVTIMGLTVTVSPGDCLINGRYGYEKNNRTFSIAGGGSLPRIDSIVLRLDMSLNARNIDLFVKTGTASASPSAPALERNETVWELGIANIRVEASQVSVNQSAVTDTRLSLDRCGIVAQAMKTIDTSTYYNQIQADLAYFKENEQEAFDAWFETVQNTLDGDVAGNLLNMIYDLQTAMPTETAPLPISRGGTEASTAEAARAMLGAVHKVSMAVSIPASYWSGSGPYRVGLNVAGVTADNDVLAEPDYSSREHYYDCGVGMVEQSQGVLVFTAQDKPTQTLLVNLLILT